MPACVCAHRGVSVCVGTWVCQNQRLVGCAGTVDRENLCWGDYPLNVTGDTESEKGPGWIWVLGRSRWPLGGGQVRVL